MDSTINKHARLAGRRSGKAMRPSTHAKTVTAAQKVAHLRAEVARLRAEIRALRSTPPVLPALPAPDADGNYPATETLRALLAQKIIRGRQTVGWTQAELAARAGVRQETISRLENGKHAPNVRTVDKIDRALRAAGV